MSGRLPSGVREPGSKIGGHAFLEVGLAPGPVALDEKEEGLLDQGGDGWIFPALDFLAHDPLDFRVQGDVHDVHAGGEWSLW